MSATSLESKWQVPSDPRKRAKALLGICPWINEVKPNRADLCNCCGSRIWDENFTCTTHRSDQLRVGGTEQAAKDYCNNILYSPEYRKRHFDSWGTEITQEWVNLSVPKWVWVGKPGIHYVIGMTKEKAIEHFWKGSPYEATAGGYDLDDPDSGVACVIWSGK